MKGSGCCLSEASCLALTWPAGASPSSWPSWLTTSFCFQQESSCWEKIVSEASSAPPASTLSLCNSDMKQGETREMQGDRVTNLTCEAFIINYNIPVLESRHLCIYFYTAKSHLARSVPSYIITFGKL